MQRIQRGAVGLLVLALLATTPCLLPAVRAADVDRFLPNDTQGVTSLNIHQILDSALVQKIGVDKLKDLVGKTEAQKFLDQVGFDPFKDLTSLTFASTNANESDKGLVIVHGKFNVDKIQAKAADFAKAADVKLKTHLHGTYKVYEVTMPDQKQPVFIALLDANTVVLSSNKDLAFEAIDKGAGKKQAAVPQSIQDLIQKTDTKQSVWLAGLLSSELLKNPLIDEKAKEVLEKIKSLHGGISLTDDVKVDFVVGAKNADDAKDLAGVIKQYVNQGKELVNLLGQNKKEFAPVIELLDSVKVNQQGNGVTIKAQISKQTINKSLDRGDT
jgi:hypothetical protein